MKRGIAVPVVYAFLILAGAFIYYRYNLLITSLLFAAIMAGFYYAQKKGAFPQLGEKGINNASGFMLFTAAAFVAAHFYGTFSPADFHEDEWADIVSSYMYITGARGFFHYIPLNGSTLPFLYKASITLVMLATKTIAYARIVPHAVFLLTCAAFYLLGREIKGKKTGAAMLLVFSMSSIIFYTSRQMMSTQFVPLFAASGLYFFLLYIRTKKIGALAASGAAVFLGFYTYSVWALTLPFWACALLAYRKEMGMKSFISSAVFLVLTACFVAACFINTPDTIHRTSHMLITQQNAGSPGFNPFSFAVEKLISIPALLTGPLHSKYTFAPELPVISFGELLLFGGGAMLLILERKNKLYLLLLAGLFFSMFSVMLGHPLYQHLRHITLFTFIMIISGIFLDHITDREYYGVFMAAYLCFSVWVFADMHASWQQRLGTGDFDSSIASYIKKEYRDRKVLVLHEINPYGVLGVALRLDNLRLDGPEKFDTVVVLSNYFMKGALARTYGASMKKIFYQNRVLNKTPVVLYEAAIKTGEDREYFTGLKKELSEVNFSMWENNYPGVLSGCAALEKKKPATERERLVNTALRFYSMEACRYLDDPRCLHELFYNNIGDIFDNADFYYYRGKTALVYKDRAGAMNSFIKANALAPWWNAPKAQLEQLKENKGL